jgi:hypothetical protein
MSTIDKSTKRNIAMNLPPTSKQLRLASLGLACISLYGLADAWVVFVAGSMEKVSCSGTSQRFFCIAGAMLGHLFQPNSPWLGYVIFQCIVGIFVFFGAWKTYLQS